MSWDRDGQAVPPLFVSVDAAHSLIMIVFGVVVMKDLSRPGYFLCLDRKARQVCLVIRGSSRPIDALTDLRCHDAPMEGFNGGFAHAGILHGYLVAAFFISSVSIADADVLCASLAFSVPSGLMRNFARE